MDRRIRTLAILFVALIFVTAVCGGFVFILAGDQIMDYVRVEVVRFQLRGRAADLDRAIGTDATPVRFIVAPGDTPRRIAQNLFAANLIVDAGLFVDYVRVEELDVELEAGTYFLNQTQNIRQIALALSDSRSSQIIFTIIEGWRIEQVAEAVSANPLFGFSGSEFLAVVGRGAQIDPNFRTWAGIPDDASLEGFLYPDTYSLPPEITPEMLRDTLIQAFADAVGTQIPQDAAARGYTLFEIVTLASIIQREAVRSDEHPLIASVYTNRLNIGMRLEADPTVQYPLGGQRGDTWWPRITVADYQGVISDYNTYRVSGLPPGPIASPGLTAIRAAVYPAESSYFFFRADCRSDGYHDFATTYEEHLANGC